MGWANDSRGVFYSLGRSFFQYDVARADSLAAAAVHSCRIVNMLA